MGQIVIKDITINLDEASVQRAIDEIRDFSYDLNYALDALCKYLLERGVIVARMRLRNYLSGKASNGNLAKSIRYELTNGKSGEGYLIAGYPGDTMYEGSNVSYAVFFEFGFGPGNYYYPKNQGGKLIKTQASIDRNLGAGNIDPSRTSGRTKEHESGKGHYRNAEEFNVMNTPNMGEFFGWVYKDRDTGHFYVSHGQNPKPFMYETMLYLMTEAERESGRIIAEYIPSGGR